MKTSHFLAILVFCSCQPSSETQDVHGSAWEQQTVEQWEQQVLSTEDSFAQYAEEHGIAEAFLAFADSSAVLMRDQKVIKDLPAYFGELHGPDQRLLTWTPEFVHVASSGDLAYTYGAFQYKPDRDSTQVMEGVFHTVWKRQSDGSWKYVWD